MAEHEKGEEISHIHDISDLCKSTFLDKDSATRTFWAICIFLITLAGSAIAWALSMSGTVSSLQTKSFYQEQKITQLDESINKKLDILIKRAEEEQAEKEKERIRTRRK